MKDMLKDLFEKQLNFQLLLNNDTNTHTYREKMILASLDELTEILRCIPWKPWKKKQKFDATQYKEEIIDLWHFVINLSLSANLTAKELHKLYNKKLKINIQRQIKGY